MKKTILEATQHQYRMENQTHLKMELPKLSSNNFKVFYLEFSGESRRQKNMHGILLDYLLREEDVGIYDTQWGIREENLKHCIRFYS